MEVKNVEKEKVRKQRIQTVAKAAIQNLYRNIGTPISNDIMYRTSVLERISAIKNNKEFNSDDIDLLAMSLLGTRQYLIKNLAIVTTIALDASIPAWSSGMPEIINDLQTFVISIKDKNAFELKDALTAYLSMPFNKNVSNPHDIDAKKLKFIASVNGVNTSTPHVGPLPTEK